MNFDTTIAAIATPPGKGGIAVIRLSGRRSYEIGEKVFIPKFKNKSVKNAKGYTALFGTFVLRGKAVDEGILLCFRAPASYTGEDVLELNCHGGEQVSKQVLQACLEAGAQPAQPGEFTKRAVLNGRLSLTQAEAVMEIISANSAQGVALAKHMLDGALYKEIEAQKQQLTQLAAHLAAYVDYPEEDVDTLGYDTFLGTVEQVCARLQEMEKQYEKGSQIRRGVRAAIVGSPNVGKSTLFNLLSGFERTIVTSVAGTTRDVVHEQIQIGGVQLHLSDTAGLHDTDDVVEQEGIKRSYDEIEKAGLVIAVFDGSLPLTSADLEIAQNCKGKPALAILNKSDLGTMADTAPLAELFREVVVVSAKQAESRRQIEEAVLRVLQLDNIDENLPTLANERQLAAVAAAQNALQQTQDTLRAGLPYDVAGIYLQDALQALGNLTGENVVESVIDDVFSRFCVGK